MNKKSLVKIINKELTILTDIVNEFQTEGDVLPFEIDMALSKTKDLYEKLLLLKEPENANPVKVQTPIDSYHKSIDNEKKDENIKKEITDAVAETQSTPITMIETVTENRVSEKAAQPIEKPIELLTQEPAGQLFEVDEVAKEDLQNTISATESEPIPENIESVLEPIIAPKNKLLEETPNKAAESEDFLVETIKEKHIDSTEYQNTKPIEKAGKSAISDANRNVKGAIIADTFQNLSPSLNDMLSGMNKNKDLASAMKERPIKNLKSAIKLNDRIWFTNELFNKNKSLFEKTIDSVNQSTNLDEALAYLFSNFTWDQNQKSTISFLELVFRRFAN